MSRARSVRWRSMRLASTLNGDTLGLVQLLSQRLLPGLLFLEIGKYRVGRLAGADGFD